MRTCANDGCEIEFDPATFNQKYHNEACRQEATNRRVMDKYYKDRARRQGQERVCETCSAKLSRYNPDTVCQKCLAAEQNILRESLLDIIGYSDEDS